MSQSCPVTNCRIRRISAEMESGSVLNSWRVMRCRVDKRRIMQASRLRRSSAALPTPDSQVIDKALPPLKTS